MGSRYRPSTNTECLPNPSLQPFSDPSFEPQIASLSTACEQVVLRSAGQSAMRPCPLETPNHRMWLIRKVAGLVKTVGHASLQINCLTLGVLVRLAADQSVPISRLIQRGTHPTSGELASACCDGKENPSLWHDRDFRADTGMLEGHVLPSAPSSRWHRSDSR